MKNFLENINCPLCKSKNFKIIKKAKYKNYDINTINKIYSSSSEIKLIDQLVKCESCQFIYLNPRIKSSIVLNSYSNSKDEKFISQNDERINTFKNCLKKICKYYDLKNKKILDIGSAGGAFLKACMDLNLNAQGIEPNKWLVNYAKRNYKCKIINGTLKNIISRKKYDVVSYWDVFEHLTDLKKEINLIKKTLKKTGLLIINIPDYDSLPRKLMKSKWPFFLNVHLYYFNENSLKKILGNKFKIIHKSNHWQTLKLDYAIYRASNYMPILKIFNNVFFRKIFKKFSINYYLGQKIYLFKYV